MTETTFFGRERYVIAADNARATEGRILVVSPAIRNTLFHLLIDEARRMEAEAAQVRRKDSPRRVRLIENADELRQLAEELAA